MPSGVYPDFKKGGKIPHPAAGLSKNKYNAKGEIIGRKSRSKLNKQAETKLGTSVQNQAELATAVGKHLLPKLADMGVGVQVAAAGKGLANNPFQQQQNAIRTKGLSMTTLAPGISKDVDLSIIPDWARQQGRKPKMSSATVSDDDAYSDSTTTPTNSRFVNSIDHPDIANAILKAAYDPRIVQSYSKKLGKRTSGYGSKMRPQDYGEMSEFLTQTGQVRKRAKGGGRKKKSPVEQAIGTTIDDVDTTEQEPNVPESKIMGQVIQNQPIINPPEADLDTEPMEDIDEQSQSQSQSQSFDFEADLAALDESQEETNSLIDALDDDSRQQEMIEKAESLGVSDIDFPDSNDFQGIELNAKLDSIEWESMGAEQPEFFQSTTEHQTSRGPAYIMIFIHNDGFKDDDTEVIGYIYGADSADQRVVMKEGYSQEEDSE